MYNSIKNICKQYYTVINLQNRTVMVEITSKYVLIRHGLCQLNICAVLSIFRSDVGLK